MFVEKHAGISFPFDQVTLHIYYENLSNSPFTGACVGVVAALLESVIKTNKPVPNFFYHKILPRHYPPSALRSIMWQLSYEKNPNHFFTVFFREVLKISATGYAEQETYTKNYQEFLACCTSKTNDNRVMLINAVYQLKTTDNHTYTQEHIICTLKHNGYYYFCDSNLSLAIFENETAFNAWLSEEIEHGALHHFSESVASSMLIDQPPTPPFLAQGQLNLSSCHLQYFSYPQTCTNQPNNPPIAKL